VTSSQLDHILRSDNPNAKVPLLEDHVACLHEVGEKLLEKYEGRIMFRFYISLTVNAYLKSFDKYDTVLE
jgi:hypothetical protein